MAAGVKVWQTWPGSIFEWRWEVSYRRPGEERIFLRGRCLTRRGAEKAGRRALLAVAGL